MLWYKSWLETRPRLFIFTVVQLFFVTVVLHGLASGTPAAKSILLFLAFMFPVFFPVVLAGTGVNTIPSFRPARGLHGSTLFTLSLPVSRFRLVAVRSALGILEVFGGVAAVFGVIWAAFPSLRAQWPLLYSLEYLLAVPCCILGVYFLTVVFAAVFEDVAFQSWAGLASIFLLRWLSRTVAIPPALNIFQAIGTASPLITHTMPWATMGVSVGASVVLFLIALKIVQARQY